jgi:tripartite-type tricarboxylate transporter receptor subunit TctC
MKQESRDFSRGRFKLLSVAIGSVSAAYPDRIVNLIVPFDPGGAVDVTCRFLAESVEKALGAKLVIMNKPGGGAVIGQTFVANAAPDGYTLLACTSSVVTNPLTKETTYTHKSFQPIALYCFDPEILVVPRNLLEMLADEGPSGSLRTGLVAQYG